MVVYEKTKFEAWKIKKTYITKIILHNYILYNGDLTCVGTFPVDSGMPSIFTDFQHSMCYRPTSCWKIYKYISEPSLGLLGKFQHRSDHHYIKYNCAILFLWYMSSLFFRWFKFTPKPPNSMAIENFFLAIWDTSHWNVFVKFGLKTPYNISWDPFWSILTHVNFWWLQGYLSNLPKLVAFRKSIFSRWRSDKSSINFIGLRWAGP